MSVGDVGFRRPPPTIALWLSRLTGDATWARPDFDLPLMSGDPAAVPVLTDLLQHQEAQVREAAVMGLWKLGPAGRPAVPALLATLADPCFEVRSAALVALERIDPAALAAHEREHPAAGREGGE